MLRLVSLFVIICITVFAAGTFGATVVRALLYAPDTEISTLSDTHPTQNVALAPTRIKIPALDIDTVVQHVGVNAQGNMATPNNFTDVGWYKNGPAPGQSGSAVIAGHVNNGLGLSGVFEHLGDLKTGDDIFVTREDGKELHFVVVSSRTYPYNDAPAEVIFNPSGSVRLNLITCDGKWVKEDKTYDQRLVVFTKLASE